jgi:hypothetical protein
MWRLPSPGARRQSAEFQHPRIPNPPASHIEITVSSDDESDKWADVESSTSSKSQENTGHLDNRNVHLMMQLVNGGLYFLALFPVIVWLFVMTRNLSHEGERYRWSKY